MNENFKKAEALIKARRFGEARQILEKMQNDAGARRWIRWLDANVPESKVEAVYRELESTGVVDQIYQIKNEMDSFAQRNIASYADNTRRLRESPIRRSPGQTRWQYCEILRDKDVVADVWRVRLIYYAMQKPSETVFEADVIPELLARLGEEGWELVTVTHDQIDLQNDILRLTHYFLKRAIPVS